MQDLGLDPIADIGFDRTRTPNSLPSDAKFKNVTADILLCLRHKLSNGEEAELVGKWANGLMRYCEIRRNDLERRTGQKWPDRTRRRLCMLQVTAFLLDYYYESRDLRFLNVVLKLSDMKWILNRGKIESGLQSTDQDVFVAALFGMRIVMMREHALARLDSEWVSP